MTEQEFRNWMVFHEHTPIDDQSNFHVPMAYLHSTTVNLQTPKEKPRVKFKDFLLFRKDEEEEQDIDALLLGGGW